MDKMDHWTWLSPSHCTFLGVSAHHMQRTEKLIPKSKCMRRTLFRYRVSFFFFFTSSFYICRNSSFIRDPPNSQDDSCAFRTSLLKGERRMMRVFIPSWKRVVHGGIMEVSWKRNGSRRGTQGVRGEERIRKDRCIEPHAIRRNRNFPGTLPPPRSIHSPSPSRGAARRTCPRMRVMLTTHSFATSFLRKSKETLARLIHAEMKFVSDSNDVIA